MICHLWSGKLTWRWREATCSERVANVVSQANTVGDVVDHLALGIGATVCLRTRVLAVQVDARQTRGTLCVGRALRPASNIRVAEVVRDALAGSSIPSPVTDSIAAAR